MRGILLALASAFLASSWASGAADPGKVIFYIDIPWDNKDEQPGHIVYRYFVYESGFTCNSRDVYDWASQARKTKQLTPEELKKATGIVHSLPDRRDKVPLDRSVIVEERLPDEKRRVYDRTKLPREMKDLFGLLGGIRGGLEDKLEFETERNTPPAPK